MVLGPRLFKDYERTFKHWDALEGLEMFGNALKDSASLWNILTRDMKLCESSTCVWHFEVRCSTVNIFLILTKGCVMHARRRETGFSFILCKIIICAVLCQLIDQKGCDNPHKTFLQIRTTRIRQVLCQSNCCCFIDPGAAIFGKSTSSMIIFGHHTRSQGSTCPLCHDKASHSEWKSEHWGSIWYIL